MKALQSLAAKALSYYVITIINHYIAIIIAVKHSLGASVTIKVPLDQALIATRLSVYIWYWAWWITNNSHTSKPFTSKQFVGLLCCFFITHSHSHNNREGALCLLQCTRLHLSLQGKIKMLKQSSNLLAEDFHRLGNNCLSLCPQTLVRLGSGLHANIIKTVI